MATLTVTEITRSGIAAALVAAAVGGDEFPNDGQTFLEVVNGAGAPITVTIVTQSTDDGLAVGDRTVTVTNAQRRLIGPFPKATYNVASTGRVQVTYSDAGSVTVGAFRLAPVS